MRTIDHEWEEYRKAVMPAKAGAEQVLATRMAFLAGASALTLLIQEQSEEDGLKVMDHLEQTVVRVAEGKLEVPNAARRSPLS